MLKNIKSLKNFLFNCKNEIILIIILSILTTLITSINPYIYGLVLNNVLDSNFKFVIELTLLLGIIHFFVMIFNVYVSKAFLVLRKKFLINIRKKACMYILSLNVDVYKKTGTGPLLNRVKDDSTKISDCFINIKNNVFIAFGNIASLFIILYINYIIGIYYIICVVILLCIKNYGIKKSLYYKSLNLEELDSNATLLNQVIKGAKDIKLLNLKKEFISKTNNSFNDISELEYKSNSYIEYTNKISQFLEAFFQGVMIILSVVLIKFNLLSISDFIVVFMYRNNIFAFINKFTVLSNNIRQFNLSFNRILSILNYDVEKFGNIEMENYKGNITFKNVSFKYGDKKILDNINLKIESNSFVSIIGPSGCGKTTLLSLISKIETPYNGYIYLDNYKLDDLTESSIRNSISLVTQAPFLFNFSIKENLSIMDNNIDHIKEVCKKVGIDKKIESLEYGYDTILSEDATNLSGGEKQKLAIARSLLADFKVILLDEITNNLDNKSKKEILNILKDLKGKYTIILVTHDLDMTKYSDRIITIDNGKIKDI